MHYTHCQIMFFMMDATSPLPPTELKLSQNVRGLASCVGNMLWRQTVHQVGRYIDPIWFGLIQ